MAFYVMTGAFVFTDKHRSQRRKLVIFVDVVVVVVVVTITPEIK